MPLQTTWMTPRRDAPLLAVGPSLGTSAVQLWRECVAVLDDVAVLAWDLPGHAGAPVERAPALDVPRLADAVLDAALGAARRLAAEHDRRADLTFAYAGDSLGGAVGLQLLLDAPTHMSAAVLLSTGARIGEPEAWADRAATVRESDTEAVVEGSIERWFAARTRVERPDLVAELVATLRGVDREGYARCCEALGSFDVTERLGEIGAPVLAVAGREDVPTPVASLAAIAGGVRDGRLEVVADAAHLPPAEQPQQVAALISDHLRAARLGA